MACLPQGPPLGALATVKGIARGTPGWLIRTPAEANLEGSANTLCCRLEALGWPEINEACTAKAKHVRADMIWGRVQACVKKYCVP